LDRDGVVTDKEFDKVRPYLSPYLRRYVAAI